MGSLKKKGHIQEKYKKPQNQNVHPQKPLIKTLRFLEQYKRNSNPKKKSNSEKN